MLVVSDTSALLALAACDGLDWLDVIFGDVRVPEAVFRECTVPGKRGAERLAVYLHGKVANVDRLTDDVVATGLGRGELEAMALYKQLRADWLLVDDDRARRIARLNSIEVIGSIGVLLVAKQRRLVGAIKPSLDAIQSAGGHISEGLVVEALRLAGEAG